LRFWLHPEAEAELGDAAVHYAVHASPSVAAAFIAEFERVRDLLIENSYRGPQGEHGLRLFHFDRFPYTVVYEPDDQMGPQIYAIAHQHREPGYWAVRVAP
jgi:plasmid stabilization system protein ParE